MEGLAEGDSFTGFVIGNNVTNNSLAHTSALDAFTPLYGKKTIGTWEGTITYNDGKEEDIYRYKVTAPEITHYEYSFKATKLYKSYYGEKKADPGEEPPVTPPGGAGAAAGALKKSKKEEDAE